MMTTTLFRSLTAACVLSLFAATVQAQEHESTQPDQPSAQQPDQQSDQQPNQEESQAEPAGIEEELQEADERYEARRVDPSATAGQGRSDIQGFLVTKLMLANKSQIELSQLASEKAQHPEVKQYAQVLIRDHEQLNQQLQQLQSSEQATSRSGEAARQNAQERRGDRAERRGDRAEGRTARPERTERAASGREAGEPTGALRRGGWNQQVPQQLTQVAQQACEKHLQMAKQMLQEKQGPKFDEAFVGMQIGAHGWMLAELQAIQNVGSPEFQQVVRQAEQKTSEHFEKAKQLAMTLESGRGAASQGADTTSPGSDAASQRSRRGQSEADRGSN